MRGLSFLGLLLLGAVILVACGPGSVAKLGDMTLTISPVVLNQNDNKVDVFVVDTSGDPVTNVTVTLEMTHHTMKMPPIMASTASQGGGHYVANVTPTMDGPWNVFADVERDGHSLGRAEFTVYVNVSAEPFSPHNHF